MKDGPKIFQKHSSNQVTKVRQKKKNEENCKANRSSKRTKEIFVKRNQFGKFSENLPTLKVQYREIAAKILFAHHQRK